MRSAPTPHRRVKILDTSHQLSLFNEDTEAERPIPVEAKRLSTPLKIRELLETLPFVEFEIRYRPSGRSPYAPQERG